MALSVLIAEDELLARNRLTRFIEDFDEFDLIGVANDGEEAFEKVKQLSPDLLVTDVSMPEKTGIELVTELSAAHKAPVVIFTTAHEDFALNAFKLNVVDYLLKPIERVALYDAMKRAARLCDSQNKFDEVNDSSVVIKKTSGLEVLPTQEIMFFQAREKYVIAGYGDNEETIIDYSLKELEFKLSPLFFRIHRNTLVNSCFLSRIEKQKNNGAYLVYLSGRDRSFEVSRRQVSAIK